MTNQSNIPTETDEPRYSIKVNGRWFPDMIGPVDTSGSVEMYAGVLGFPATALVIDNVEKYRVATERSGWGEYITGYDRENPAGDGSRILAIDIKDPHVLYMVHTKGGSWSKPVYGTDEMFAGDMLPIDGVQILRV